MMDTVRLENESGKIFRLTDYGLYLKYFDAPEPEAKTYRETIDGADGDLDMTEWAGIIRYNTRNVSFGVRDLSGHWWRELVNFCHGRNVKITHSLDEEHYYFGRIRASHTTQEHITDVELEAVCNPYRLCHTETIITKAVTGSATVSLEALRRPVTPTVTVSAEMNLTYLGTGITLPAGTHQVDDLILSETPVSVTITGTGTITFKWRDGVI